jgi:hypothetical protein
MSEALSVSGVPTMLVDGIRLFSGAIRRDLMEAELRKAGGHVSTWPDGDAGRRDRSGS